MDTFKMDCPIKKVEEYEIPNKNFPIVFEGDLSYQLMDSVRNSIEDYTKIELETRSFEPIRLRGYVDPSPSDFRPPVKEVFLVGDSVNQGDHSR